MIIVRFLDDLLFSLSFPFDLLTVLGVMALIAVLATIARTVSVSGSICAFIFGTVVLYDLRFEGFILFLLYFLICSVVSKISDRIRKDRIVAKGSRRDFRQVCSNGFFAFFAALWFSFSMKPSALVMFGVAIAESAADTFASDIGKLSTQMPVSILNFRKKEERGTSGAVTSLGIIASFVACVVFSCLWYEFFRIKGWGLIILASFTGSIVDSILGATCQALYRDDEGNITEKETKNLIRGIRWMDNDMVNFISNLFSCLLALGLMRVYS